MMSEKIHPYAAYSSIDFSVVTEQTGDVQGRLMVKIGEIYQSLKIIEQALNIMPSSAITMEIVEITKEKIGFSLVETPRGEALHWILGEKENLIVIKFEIPHIITGSPWNRQCSVILCLIFH